MDISPGREDFCDRITGCLAIAASLLLPGDSFIMPSVPAPLILSYSAKTPSVSPKATTWPRFMSMQRLHSERTVAKE